MSENESEKRETLVDIETELRALSQSSKYCELQPTVFGKPISFYFAEIADRIKAAAPTTEKSSAAEDRFRDATKTNGNAAAMREALKLALSLLNLGKGCSYKTISQKDIDFIKSALATPARNCDRFATVKDAAMAFADERHNAPHPCPDFTFSTWLLAPAAEQKGDGDGSK